MSDRSEILANIARLKEEHRALRHDIAKAYKQLEWPKVAILAERIQANIDARAWRVEKLR